MKKLLLTLLVLIIATSAAFAGFTFQLGPFKPNFPSSLVDPFSSLSGLHYLIETKGEHQNEVRIFNEEKKKFELREYRDLKEDSSANVHVNVGLNFSVLRFGFEDIVEVGLIGQAGLNTVFQVWNGFDNAGFDGSWFLGGEAKIMDMFVLKAGLKHYSGHWGDEIAIKTEQAMTANGNRPNNYSYDEYVRDNQWKVGIAFTGVKNLNVLASVAAPMPKTNLRPFLVIPDYIRHTNSGDLYIEREPELYAERGPLENYHALIIQLEAQYELPITKNIGLLLGANVKFHEDGRMNYTMDPSDDDPNRWDVEYSLIAAINLKNAIENFSLSLDFIWHEGRFPLLNYYYRHSQYMSVGLSIR